MSLPKPNGRVETYLSYLNGNTDIKLPVPIGREEQYLYNLCVNGVGVSDEQIGNAVNNYLTENPVEPTPIDKTLTLENQAADSKIVGDEFKKIYSIFKNKKCINLEDYKDNYINIIKENKDFDFYIPNKSSFNIPFGILNQYTPTFYGNGNIIYANYDGCIKNLNQFIPNIKSPFYDDMRKCSECNNNLMWEFQRTGSWLWDIGKMCDSSYQTFNPWGQIMFNNDYIGDIPENVTVYIRLNNLLKIKNGKIIGYINNNFNDAVWGMYYNGSEQSETPASFSNEDGCMKVNFSHEEISNKVFHFFTKNFECDCDYIIYDVSFTTNAPKGYLCANIACDLKTPLNSNKPIQEIGGTRTKLLTGNNTFFFTNNPDIDSYITLFDFYITNINIYNKIDENKKNKLNVYPSGTENVDITLNSNISLVTYVNGTSDDSNLSMWVVAKTGNTSAKCIVKKIYTSESSVLNAKDYYTVTLTPSAEYGRYSVVSL